MFCSFGPVSLHYSCLMCVSMYIKLHHLDSSMNLLIMFPKMSWIECEVSLTWKHKPSSMISRSSAKNHHTRNYEVCKMICNVSPSNRTFADWYKDKEPYPWFFPSVMKHQTKIPQEIWYLTPGDTNLNESAHPFTNQFTGTNLSLLDAIQGYVLLPQLADIVLIFIKAHMN